MEPRVLKVLKFDSGLWRLRVVDCRFAAMELIMPPCGIP